MKYHIAVKFLAIFLCAACLLGAVGSAAGMIVLSEMDLYNNTVDEVLEKEIRDSGRNFAREAALYYASTELGGCPEGLVAQHYSNQWYNQFYSALDYGYVIRDAEGNMVAGSNVELAETGKCYSFPVTGQYMYLVSQIAVEDENEEPQNSSSPLGDAYGVYDIVPEGGAAVYGISAGFSGLNPAGSDYGSSDSMGVLYHDSGKDPQSITFLPAYNGEGYRDEWFAAGAMHYVSFQGIDGQVLYEASVPQGITWEYTGGSFTFTPSMRGTASTGSLTSVYLAEFYSMEDPEQTAFMVYGDEAIGYMYYDENGKPVVNLHSILDGGAKASGVVAGGQVSGVSLYDANGKVILESRDTGLVTISEDGMVYYHALPAGGMPARSVKAASEEEPADEAQPEEAEPEEAAAQNDDQGEHADGQEGDPDPQDENVPEEDPQEQDPEEGRPEEASEEEGHPDGETEPEATEATEATIVTEAAQAAVIPETTAPQQEATQPAAAAAIEMVEPTEPVYINGKLLTDYAVQSNIWYDPLRGEEVNVKFVYTPMPEYTVELYVAEAVLRYEAAYTLLEIVRNFRSDLFLILGGCLLLFAVGSVYLCCAAGHKPKREEIHAGGLCCMPLDLNIGISGCVITALIVGIVGSAEHFLQSSIETGCMVMGGLAFLASLFLVQVLYCGVSQFKTPGGYWWRNSICGRLLVGCWKLLKWMVTFLPEKLSRALKFLWNLASRILRFLWQDVLVRAAHWIGGLIRKFMGLLPLMWQWLLVGAGLIFLDLILVVGIREESSVIVAIALNLVVVLYVAYCFGVLMKSAKKMGKGDLNTKVDDKRLVGCFQEFAGDLNDLADVAVVAAQKQLKSERMKTELITNVSHDIKTPLTSIINYVDLLQKPHTEEEEAMYLEVLARQSQRLKKLIEDLMDMSKASTGNMSVDIATLDAVEAVNQALGEFADKLDRAELIPVFRHSEPTVPMQADGRLTWRVLSNLLGNAVKYAMPGTRLYIDLMQVEGKVVISLKNISRDELNVDSEELMERFVRGDDSRNTEGSGLGLNIAKSLMELQKGQLQLLVDGDLFKVTLIFPGA